MSRMWFCGFCQIFVVQGILVCDVALVTLTCTHSQWQWHTSLESTDFEFWREIIWYFADFAGFIIPVPSQSLLGAYPRSSLIIDCVANPYIFPTVLFVSYFVHGTLCIAGWTVGPIFRGFDSEGWENPCDSKHAVTARRVPYCRLIAPSSGPHCISTAMTKFSVL